MDYLYRLLAVSVIFAVLIFQSGCKSDNALAGPNNNASLETTEYENRHAQGQLKSKPRDTRKARRPLQKETKTTSKDEVEIRQRRVKRKVPMENLPRVSDVSDSGDSSDDDEEWDEDETTTTTTTVKPMRKKIQNHSPPSAPQTAPKPPNYNKAKPVPMIQTAVVPPPPPLFAEEPAPKTSRVFPISATELREAVEKRRARVALPTVTDSENEDDGE